MVKLYHKDIYLPETLKAFCGVNYSLNFSKHARNACITDRYGLIIPPKQLQFNFSEIVEIETFNDKVVKIVIRRNYDKKFDLIIVLIPENKAGFVKTLWLNEKTDSHKTLNPAPYQSHPK